VRGQLVELGVDGGGHHMTTDAGIEIFLHIARVEHGDHAGREQVIGLMRQGL